MRRARSTPPYFDKPYYLAPEKAGRKAYALLRETLSDAKRVALAKIVIRTRQHLAAHRARGRRARARAAALPLRAARRPTDLDLPGADLKAAGVTEAELTLAEQLVDGDRRAVRPRRAEYRDTYRDDLLALIRTKVEGGEVVGRRRRRTPAHGAEVVDIVALLKRSLDEAKKRAGLSVVRHSRSTAASATSRSTPEPAGAAAPRARAQAELTFVIQKHAARARCTTTSASRSTACSRPGRCRRGRRSTPHDKRLAVHVEDHPHRVRRVRGRHPRGRVRRRHGDDLGPRDVGARSATRGGR